MQKDDIVEEVRAIREAYAARFGFDPVAMGRDLRENGQSSGRKIIYPPAKIPADNPRVITTPYSIPPAADVLAK